MTDEELAPSLDTCRNCGNQISQAGKYCPVCGQKRTSGLVKARELVKDFLETVFNLDSRLFHTIPELFIPGRLTKRYFEGKHESYYKPIRLFFTTMIVFIGIVGFKYLNQLQDQLTSQTPYQSYLTSVKLNQDIDAVVEAYAQDTVLTADERVPVDGFIQDLRTHVNRRSSQTGLLLPDTSIAISLADLHELPVDSLLEQHQIHGGLRRLVARQIIKAQKTPDRFFNFAIGNTTWMIVLLVPAVALLMKLFYLRRKKYYVEHLILLYHYHALVFVVLTFYFLIFGILPSALIYAVPIALVLFLFFTLKRYYQQSIFKTFIKLLLLLLAYSFTLFLFALATMGVSFLFFQ